MDAVGAEILDRQQRPADRRCGDGHEITTPSSVAATDSSELVGRFLPTKSGRIGSSRWPRSTSTASCTARGSAVVADRVEGRPDRATGVEHVVDEHDGGAVRRRSAGRSPRPATTGRSPMSSRYRLASTDPTGTGADDASIRAIASPRASASHTPPCWMPISATRSSAVVALDDLVRHPGDRASHVVGPQDLLGALRRAGFGASSHVHPFRAGLSGPASRSEGKVPGTTVTAMHDLVISEGVARRRQRSTGPDRRCRRVRRCDHRGRRRGGRSAVDRRRTTVDADGLLVTPGLGRRPHALRRPGVVGSRTSRHRRGTASPRS